jgi:acyl-CoA synthetase (AMP-forming)/AMP-acid ligase II
MEEILGTLWLGGQLVLLRHSMYLDMDYISLVINDSQVTFMSGVSTLFARLAQHLEESENSFLPTLRCLCFGGKLKKCLY